MERHMDTPSVRISSFMITECAAVRQSALPSFGNEEGTIKRSFFSPRELVPAIAVHRW